MATGKHYFIESIETGGYRVIAKGAKKASTTTKTQKEAIAAVKRFNPEDHPDVSRARETETGKPDQWRAVKKR